MSAPSTWPVDTDLIALFTRAGLTAPASGICTAMIAAAVGQMERRTGYIPFFGSESPVTRYYDPPGYHSGPYSGRRGGDRFLRLDNGLLSVTSLMIAGTAKTVNVDYWLRPANAAAGTRPYEWIEFLGPVFGQANDIAISGIFGYCHGTIPDDAWRAVLLLAGILAIGEIKEGKLAGLVQQKERDVDERYGELTLARVGDEWRKESDMLVGSFKRVVGWN